MPIFFTQLLVDIEAEGLPLEESVEVAGEFNTDDGNFSELMMLDEIILPDGRAFIFTELQACAPSFAHVLADTVDARLNLDDEFVNEAVLNHQDRYESDEADLAYERSREDRLGWR